MAAPPPPPPPHGEAPKTTAGGASGLPTGKYDIFVIPEHSAGSGFLYLPSLRTNTNSFIAGFASALLMVVLGQSMAPAFQAWWANFQGMGNAGMILLVVAVGLGAWSLGRQQVTGSPGAGGSTDSGFYPGGGSMPGGGGFSSAGSTPRSAHTGSTPNGGTHSQAPPGGSQPSANRPNASYQRPPQSHPEPEPEPQPQTYARPPPKPEPEPSPQPPPPRPPQPSAAKPQPETPKTQSAWEKAREEVRRAEEERKAKQAEDKRRADAAARLKELREKEAKERAAREAEKQRREAEEKEKKEKEAKEARAKELRERLVREREDRRKKLEEEKRLRKEQEENESRKSSAYAYSGLGEKTNPWPAGKPSTASPQAGNPTRSPSPNKKPPAPTARTATEEETYSYRPYDQPKRRPGGSSRMSQSDIQSESSWAPSHSTSRTTPPPSVRGAYTTKDPDKIVIKAVYCFMNQFAKTPASQLVSGVGSVTDGLILRITTEGMFIDDDVRGVAQREWDVKAWTLKNVEVWCPVHFLDCAIAANSPPTPAGSTPSASAKPSLSTAFFAKTMGGTARLRAAERTASKTLTGGDADTYLGKMLACCKGSCRLGDCASAFGGTNDDASSVTSGSTPTNSTVQTGDWKARGLHLLRATIRDMDGKRYMFVIGEEEGWKVAVGLQRLRKGTQVRSLGVAGLSGIDTKNTLEMLGWG